ncbi:MAG: ABC transporter ATP-binding protein [Candidatus Saccharibacteria bacterium]
MATSILTDQLTKYYGHDKVAALKSLSISIEPGEVYGFLGANGAGKSTTIRLLLNFLHPTSGSAIIMGLDSVKQSVEVKKHVGYLSGDVELFTKPTGKELLDYLGSLHKVTGNRKALEKRFEADLDKPIGNLSKGNRQKIGLIQAFMHQPDVLILDEPTSGLDPLMQEAFYETVRESKQRGAAILMSSHNLAEAQRICDRIGIVRHGKLVHEQTLNHDATLAKTIFKVIFTDPAELQKSKSAKGLKFLSNSGAHTALLQPTGEIKQALESLSHFEIRELTTRSLDLEDDFLEFYGDAS